MQDRSFSCLCCWRLYCPSSAACALTVRKIQLAGMSSDTKCRRSPLVPHTNPVCVLRTAAIPLPLPLHCFLPLALTTLRSFTDSLTHAVVSLSHNSTSHGMLERAISRLTNKTLEFGVYCYIYAHWAPYHFQESTIINILAFIGIDLGYYWFHRMAHEINLLWATHSVHHSSEEYVRSILSLLSPIFHFTALFAGHTTD